jgi:hypothetical protein
MRTYYRGTRSRSTNDERVTAYEAAVLRQGHGAICTHDWTIEAIRLNPSLDNAARGAVQEAGQKACKAAQLAALAADPPDAPEEAVNA